MRNTILLSSLMAASLHASTIAYWRFEAGPADTNVIKNAPSGTTFYPSVPDSSGNGNDLSVWETGGGAGYVYRANTSNLTVTQTGAANNFSVENTGGGPAMFTQTGGFLQTWTPSTFTFEVSIKPENGGYRTIIGRDSQGGNADNPDLAAMYFQIQPDNSIAFKYLDLDGNFHSAASAANVIQGWSFGSGSPNDVPWQNLAAVSDGTTLTIWLDNGSGYTAVASLALGSGNTALSAGTGDGGDWDAGDFSVGRGLYGGGHTDRGYGLIDEVRISDTALTPSQFLFAVPEPGVAMLGLLGAAGILKRRRN